jgi:hypothetical protein
LERPEQPENKTTKTKMKRMKKCKMILVALLLGTASYRASTQWEVTDPLALAQQILQLARMGDPAAIKVLAGLGELKAALASPGSGLSLNKLQKLADGLRAMNDDGNGLFTPIQDRILTPDGTVTARDEQEYRKFDAVAQTTANFKDVQKETEGRRLELQGQMRDTLRQVQLATTQAEVDKLKVVVAAQGNALAALHLEHAEAVARVTVQDTENRTDKEKQSQAAKEDSAASLKSASSKVADFLKPNSGTALIPETVPVPAPAKN